MMLEQHYCNGKGIPEAGTVAPLVVGGSKLTMKSKAS